jgi:hypothetical protein
MAEEAWEPAQVRLSPRDAKIFQLNMIRLGHIRSNMKLTVEERRILDELVEAYFGKGEKVPPLPWTAREGNYRG